MSLPRCPHGVYNGGKQDGEPSEHCSGCVVPTAPLNKQQPVPELPYGKKECPQCGSPKFRYKSEWDFNCPNCGFNILDL